MAVFRDDAVEIIPNELNQNVTPSCVAFDNFERIVGDAARGAYPPYAVQCTVCDIKRIIGRRFDDPVVQQVIQKWPVVVKNVDGEPQILIPEPNRASLYSPEEISAMVLCRLKTLAEKRLGKAVTKAVVSVPANFNNAQRQATIDAGLIAGLDVLKIINEPTAAAVAFNFAHRAINANKTLLVFDFGGGTLDVSILCTRFQRLEVKATAGDMNLGGERLTELLIDYCIERIEAKYNVNIRRDRMATRRLRNACELTKQSLSYVTRYPVTVDEDLVLQVSRVCFEALCAPLFQQILDPVQRALSDAQMRSQDIDQVILVGGSSLIPKVQQIIREFFVNQPVDVQIQPAETIAYGAAVHAALLTGYLRDHSFAAFLTDVTPLSLGIGCALDYERMDILLPRNSTWPTIAEYHTSTFYDNQQSVRFPIYQGESARAQENFLLGEFVLRNIMSGRRGTPRLHVAFQIDTNGILTVSAKDERSNSAESIVIEHSGADKRRANIERMIRNAAEYKKTMNNPRSFVLPHEALEAECIALRSKINGMDIESSVLRKCDEVLHWIYHQPYHDNEQVKLYSEQLAALVDSVENGDFHRSLRTKKVRFSSFVEYFGSE